MTWLEQITDSLYEIGAYAPGDTVEAPVMALCQRWLNRIIDRWAGQRRFAYSQIFSLYNIIPNLAVHLLGPGAAITATSLTGNVATYTAANNFAMNDPVTVIGTTNGGGIFNVTGATVAFSTSSYFTVNLTHADVGNRSEKGTASNSPSVGADATPVAPNWLTPNGQPRPPQIDGCNLVLNSSNPSTDLIVNIRDSQWWLNNQVKAIPSTIPTDLYADGSFPNSGLNFWPIPTVAYQVRLETRQQLTQVVDLTTSFVAPPTYSEAIHIELACSIAGALSKAITPDLAAKRRVAIAALESNNMAAPRIASADYGAGLGGRREGFNWVSGLPAGYSGGR